MHLIGPFTQILTCNGLPLKGSLADEQLEIIPDAGVLIEEEKIVRVGPYAELAKVATTHLPVEGPSVLVPGLIDAHTHICFGGNRARDYALRSSGVSYLEIARQGGGIWSSVTQTRAASLQSLTDNTLGRARQLLAQGITTAEVKSGYGLSLESELRMLRAIKDVDRVLSIDLVPTCLAAHVPPRDFEGGPGPYLDHVLADLLPGILEEGLSKRVDIFIEETAFPQDIALPFLQKAKAMGFDLTVHADQFHTGGSRVAIEAGALSADHLEASGEDEIAALASSEVICTALPGASLGLGMGFTPARKLLDAGAALAIASDWNPGSGPMGELLTQAAILGIYEKLSMAEVWAGVTVRAAAALGLEDRGRLAPGLWADMVAFPTDNYQEILYRQGGMKPNAVWKRGLRI